MSESSSGRSTRRKETCGSDPSCDFRPMEAPRWSALWSPASHTRSDSGISSLLPSDSCKYLTWSKVGEHDVQGSQLRCPRVREGPPEEDFIFKQVGCASTPRQRVLESNRWETWLQENWEDCTNLNISFQDLGDLYQVQNFNRILRRLIRVEILWLVDNSLVDLSAIRLPSCRILNLNKNHLTTFKQLPKIPQIQHLSLAENHIESLTGLSSLRQAPLEALTLKRNPCEFNQSYRRRVFSCLPNLKILDGILKLPEDHSPPESNIFSKMCVIS
ncbi:acidic leucine-rich nuclear phosphoprotein 32-related protein-like isoform X2 [Ochotona princeps]|uniref:acidic leucine-rich nuclear phosphoprotein 32-related protein-like isoform X2 n=1 Tax=Ochotona princeps TaxID=9978 RepID=UPI0027146165|nr:acidic leucine-rich nuclear phosphoprotein 32-related protein-like isoform X2 [Ochotona princeps]